MDLFDDVCGDATQEGTPCSVRHKVGDTIRFTRQSVHPPDEFQETIPIFVPLHPVTTPHDSKHNHTNHTMSQQSQRKPPLLALPQELRDIIYEFTFTGIEANLTSPHASERSAGLLEACRQTRAEAEKP